MRNECSMYRVVVADDEGQFRQWLMSLLESDQEFQVVGQAESGAEAQRLVPELSPDVLIADVEMPDGDGLDVARYVRRNCGHLNVKVIIVSAHAERSYERMAREEGAVAFIPKVKLSLDALRQALQTAA